MKRPQRCQAHQLGLSKCQPPLGISEAHMPESTWKSKMPATDVARCCDVIALLVSVAFVVVAIIVVVGFALVAEWAFSCRSFSAVFSPSALKRRRRSVLESALRLLSPEASDSASTAKLETPLRSSAVAAPKLSSNHFAAV